MATKKELTKKQSEELLHILNTRFEKNMQRHKGTEWLKIKLKLEANPEKLWSLYKMEETGGEPDVVAYDKITDNYFFYDCSPESPKDRRSICYDIEAWKSRKDNKPKNSAIEMAHEMVIEILSEDQYRELQKLGPF